jgi:large subunit ribosomal protein L22
MANNETTLEATATSKFVRVSPRKARIVIDLVRGKKVSEAREILQFSERAISETVLKTLNSAVANAVNNHGMLESTLYVKTATADEGPTLKRIRPRAKGSANRINKRTSHIRITVATSKEA